MRLLVVILAWLHIASVHAATFEQLVMPGPLIEGHADLESDCDNCHVSFERTAQDRLCLDCHEAVAKDVADGAGFHGRRLAQERAPCQSCHTDHKGRDADVVRLNVELFDHALTDFALEGRHVGVACASCHAPEELHREAPGECVGCHRDDEPHKARLGDDCAACHDASAWTHIRFDHATTDFPLTGAHRDPPCDACHVNEVWQDLSTACVSCHALDDSHNGTRGTDCGNCHSTTQWKVERFDHLAKTGFALEGRHAELDCPACHLADMARPEPPETCFGCHSSDDVHAGQNGRECASCHSSVRWDDVAFDHAVDTDFPLRGAHEGLECASCHVDSLEAPLPTTCDECHADDDPHDGALAGCGRCHSEASWHDVAFNHDFTTFPLIGQHRVAGCEACHTGTTFAGTESRCIACHADDDRHRGGLGDDCGRCHNPNGWTRWEFDHNLDAHFLLDGAHVGLECDACHRPGGPPPVELSTVCVSCHRADDAHDGRFGPDCARCHTTRAFSDMEKFR